MQDRSEFNLQIALEAADEHFRKLDLMRIERNQIAFDSRIQNDVEAWLADLPQQIADDKYRRELVLENCSLDENQMKALCKALIKNQLIKEILIKRCEIQGEGYHYLPEYLKSSKSIVSFTIENGTEYFKDETDSCLINDIQFASLASALASNTSLKTFEVSSNLITSVEELAHALTSNSTLENLYLYNNEIGSEGMRVLASAISKHPSLKSIDLRANHIGDEASMIIAKALHHNTVLEELKVGDQPSNSARDQQMFKAAKSFAELMKYNHHLRCLELQFFNIPTHFDENAKQRAFYDHYLIDGLQFNPFITDMPSNDHHPKILALLKRNRQIRDTDDSEERHRMLFEVYQLREKNHIPTDLAVWQSYGMGSVSSLKELTQNAIIRHRIDLTSLGEVPAFDQAPRAIMEQNIRNGKILQEGVTYSENCLSSYIQREGCVISPTSSPHLFWADKNKKSFNHYNQTELLKVNKDGSVQIHNANSLEKNDFSHPLENQDISRYLKPM